MGPMPTTACGPSKAMMSRWMTLTKRPLNLTRPTTKERSARERRAVRAKAKSRVEANKEPSKKAKGDADSAHKTKWRVYIDQKELRKKGSTNIEAWPSIMSDDAEHFYGENTDRGVAAHGSVALPHPQAYSSPAFEDILDDTMSIDWSKALVSPDEYIDMLSVIVFAAEGLMESFSQARETTAFEATVVEAAQHNVEIVEAESTIHDPLPPRVMEGFVVTKKVNGKLGLAKQLHDTHKWLVIAPDKHTAQLLNKDCIPKPVAEVAEAVKNDKSAGICFVTVTEDGTLVHEYRAWKTITSRPFTTDDDWDASAAKALSEKFAAVAPASEEAAIGHKPAAEDVPLPSRISNGFVAVREKDGKVGFKTEQHDGKCWLLIAESERDVMLAAKGAVVKPVAGFTESIGKRKVCDAGVCFVHGPKYDSLVRENSFAGRTCNGLRSRKQSQIEAAPSTLYHGDVADWLPKLKPGFDACLTDPPYGLTVFGNDADTLPSVAVWQEVLRLLKPGGWLLAFGGTLFWDCLTSNIRNNGGVRGSRSHHVDSRTRLSEGSRCWQADRHANSVQNGCKSGLMAAIAATS